VGRTNLGAGPLGSGIEACREFSLEINAERRERADPKGGWFSMLNASVFTAIFSNLRPTSPLEIAGAIPSGDVYGAEEVEVKEGKG